MTISIALCLATASTAYIIHLTYSFYCNLIACRASGIPYVVVPFQPHSIVAQILRPVWRPLFLSLPSLLKGNWVAFMNNDIHWNELYAPFRQAGFDTVLACSPGSVLLHSASAEVIHQISERRTDYPKPVHIYHIIDIYGKTIISSDGQLWRKHRKIASVPFTEKNNHIVWEEALYQTQAMLSHLFDGEKDSSDTIEDAEHLTSRVALAIISRAGYGVRIAWPGQEDSHGEVEIPGLDKEWVEGKTNGHTMSYSDAIFTISNNIIWIMMVPKTILKYLPFEAAKRSYQAYWNWGQYMQEMVDAKRSQLDAGPDAKHTGTDLLASLVTTGRATTVVEDQTTKSGKIGVDGLSDDELLGNAFVLIVAGHETTAGTLYTGLILLAMWVDSQREMQRDLDRIFNGRPPSEWVYEKDFNPTFEGSVGAVLSETLRWLPSVPSVPKWTEEAQSLKINGSACTVPKSTLIALNICAAHRNPNQWPHCKPSRPDQLENEQSNPDDDLGEFRPGRWLQSIATDGTDNEGKGSSGVYRPVRGSYLPFSEGGRGCLGRRFAQVEIIAMLAVLFQNYSVELAVDEWASDEEVEAMNTEERQKLWQTARDKAQWKFRNCMQALMTNKMTKGRVPLRIVKRGKERFNAEHW